MNWKKIMFIVGTVALIIGAVDPLEGSVVILAGSILVFISARLTGDPFRKQFLIAMIMIFAGVFLMFLFSWLGGFGGDDSILPWWMIFLIIPYPAGWIMTLVVLIIRAVKKRKGTL
ncbi:hypothetical protein [Spirochaeta isovalerica]|uniref:Putative membrane protein n=1 Tax=Spirochaeta isovalerica TaxID=150 RepID=A0A841RB93_9SPIO|nr:hypothetical protein [Spirochaeta isovalerica]MBB6480517.1 putative membrane protein [Spirochaeta isovalerica]